MNIMTSIGQFTIEQDTENFETNIYHNLRTSKHIFFKIFDACALGNKISNFKKLDVKQILPIILLPLDFHARICIYVTPEIWCALLLMNCGMYFSYTRV